MLAAIEKLFRSILGGGILVYLIWHYLNIDPFPEWIFLIPGALLQLDFTAILKK